MKNIIKYFYLLIAILLQKIVLAQNDNIVIGVKTDSTYIYDFDNLVVSSGDNGILFYYFDIDNNDEWDFRFYCHFSSGWDGGIGGSSLTTSDSTYFTLDTMAVQWIGACNNSVADTTHQVKLHNQDDILSTEDYYTSGPGRGSALVDFHISSDPCWHDPYLINWQNSGDHFIGIKKIYNGKTYLGWLKIEVTEPYSITFKEFAIHSTFKPYYPILNEFMAWNSTIADEYGEYDNWIEIYNPHSDSISLKNLMLTNDTRSSIRWVMPDIYLQAGEHIIFWADNQPEQGVFHTNFRLRNYGELAIGLYNHHGKLIDHHYYNQQIENESEGRYPDAAIGQWAGFPYPSPGANNILDVDLKINEFMASNTSTIHDEYGEFQDWIEIFNAGSESIRLDNFYLTDNLEVKKQWKMPKEIINPNEYKLIWADNQPEQGPFHSTFKLDDDGEMIGLFGITKKEVDSYTFSEQTTNISEGRYPNASDNWEFFTNPTPKAFNGFVSVNENNSINILKVFPNPSMDSKFFFNKDISCKVYDSKGQILFIKTKTKHIDLSEYPNGLYFVLTDTGEQIKLIKLTK